MSGRLRLLDLVKPFLPILPEVEMPFQKIQYDEKLLWLATCGILFYVMNELPLYAVKNAAQSDPLYWVRPVFASTRGRLTELGLLPMLTSAFVLQLLGGNHWIDVNFDIKSDRELFQTAQKLFAVALSIFQALLLVFSGAYGTSTELGTSAIFWIVLQIVGGSSMLLLLSEILEKGYGMGSGTYFFTGLHICQLVVWRAFSLSSEVAGSGRGAEVIGSLTSFGHMLWTRNIKNALIKSFYRTHLPNMFELYGSVIVFGLAVYLMSFRIELPIKSTKVKSPSQVFPIRLMYTGSLPVFIVAIITANIFLLSVALYNIAPYNVLVRLLGTWRSVPDSPQLYAASGLSYYLQPPASFAQAIWDPIKSIVYVLFVIITCVVFARNWSNVSGSAPKDIAKSFKAQGVVILGHRETSATKELKRLIPVAAEIGGAITGLVMVTFDLLGFRGIGATILVGAGAMYCFFEELAQEGGGFPGLAGAL